jgi:branched-chain amino acid transport system substrate-binding protein
LHLWALAAEKANSLKLDAVGNALPQVSWAGPRGTVSYSQKTHHATFPIYLAKLDAKGAPEVIKDFGPVDPGANANFRAGLNFRGGKGERSASAIRRWLSG